MVIPEVVSISVERVPVDVTVPVGVDPTGDTVQLAFMLEAGQIPGVGDWKVADWQPGQVATSAKRTFRARCLIGPGTANGQLAIGTHRVFIKVTDNPEVPIKPAGQLKVV